MDRPVITGVTFAPDVASPVEVTDPDATWGWFGTGLSVRASGSKAEAYATARRIANRSQASVQIYARSAGQPWVQVDVIAEPDRQVCEWWPERGERATGVEGEGCQNEAVVSVGAKTEYHLCDECANAPRFRRMRRNRRLAGHYDD